MSGKSASATDLRALNLFSKPDRFISTFASQKSSADESSPSSGLFKRNNTDKKFKFSVKLYSFQID